jgi:hypothetical protein
MRANDISLPQIPTAAWLERFWSVTPGRTGPSLSSATAWRINHQRWLSDERCNFNFPIERVSTCWANRIPMVKNFDGFLRDDVILKQRYFTLTVYIGTDCRFDPKSINNVGF